MGDLVWFPSRTLLYLHLVTLIIPHSAWVTRSVSGVDRLDFLCQLLETRFDANSTSDFL